MTTSSKLQSIEQKITKLKQQKEQVARQHLQALARLIQRCGLADFTPETLAGALLEVKDLAPQKQEDWYRAGKMFLQPKRTTKARQPASQITQNHPTDTLRATSESSDHAAPENM
ncbi:MAG: conjugal transfer protein TraD [Pseudomonadota bacterium]